jgi:hypothetical protein
MNKEVKVDYAPHYLQIDSHLKLVHDLLKCGNYVDAITLVEQITVESRLLRAAIKSHVKN